MDENLVKSLEALIDETLEEIQELKKSRFSAAEVSLEGPGDNLNGKNAGKDKDVNGGIDKKEDEEEDEEEDEDKEEKAEKKEDKDEDKEEKAEKSEAVAKKEDCDPKEEKEEKKAIDKLKNMHKAEDKMGYGSAVAKSEDGKDQTTETLMKSYVDERLQPLETKLASILELVNKIADMPVPAKGVPAGAAPLAKSEDATSTESLSKSFVSSKLFELKKSGTPVDTTDITKAEIGVDLQGLVKKYNIK